MKPTMKEVLLDDAGKFVEVPASDYPLVQEWLWQFEPKLGHVIRYEHGRVVYLYHELLRRHLDDGLMLVLPDDSVEVLFAHWTAFEKLIDMYVDRVTAADDAFKDIVVPDPVDLLTLSLTAALYAYLRWKREGKYYMIDAGGNGPDGLEIVAADFEVPTPEWQDYPSLGHWMFAEFTGQWKQEDDDGPDGIPAIPTPQSFSEYVGDLVLAVMLRLLHGSNPDWDMAALFEFFEERKLPLDEMGEAVHSLVQTYRLPL